MPNPAEFLWKPSESFKQSCHVHSLMQRLGVSDREALWKYSVTEPAKFWDGVMKDLGVSWYEPYQKVLNTDKGIAWTRWFEGGKTNLALNCVDRHGDSPKDALVWEGDQGEIRKISYKEFSEQVNQTANALKKLGVKPGETVGILMPMVPEVVIQFFACLKIGAVAIPIFSGFGVQAIRDRLRESGAVVLFTSDCSYRRGKSIPVKASADEACEGVESLRAKIVFRRGDGECPWNETGDYWWHDFVLSQSKECETLPVDAEAKGLIIFTSGTTGKPKGAVHTHAGCLATVGKELRYSFNADENSRFFWFTDIGWMMGPWEMIGVTLFGGTLFLFEGAPDYPNPSRLWEVIERHQISHLGISPTAIRLLMRSGEESVKPYGMPSLRILGSTGETWDEESYRWFFKNVGKNRCPIINVSGGTEIMGCLLAPLPLDSLKPCSLGGPGLGVDLDVFDESGQSVRGEVGHLVCKQPLPSMTKGFLNDDERYLKTYFSRWDGIWYHGDWARVDEDGQWFLHGRSDDTMNIAGKRIGPNDFEAALMRHEATAEAAAIGVPDELKGEACVCYVVLKEGFTASEELRTALRNTVVEVVGKSLAPREIKFVTLVPKTRSAKIVRALIRKLYLGEIPSNTASVENLDALEAIKNAV